jgi:primosomal protein N' (replication factor Y)
MSAETTLIRVALAVPLDGGFDYLWTGAGGPPAVGCRVRVPFGRRERVGIVLEHPASTPLPRAKLRACDTVLDDSPLIAAELLDILRFAADYYHHPIGEVVKHALPGALRAGEALAVPPEQGWRLTPAGREEVGAPSARRGKRQAAVLQDLAAETVLGARELARRGAAPAVLRRLAERGWVEPCELAEPAPVPQELPRPAELEPTPDQTAAVEAIEAVGDGFAAFLLHGVTGSGKTEVFLRLVAKVLDRGRQTLLLVPEIGLTPQLEGRLRERFGDALVVLHSALTQRERALAWRKAQVGEAMLVVGTRSAVFAPLPCAGLVIVDEEHDTSYKQQDGFRYSARDLAVARARRLGVRIVLASATPSLESLQNAHSGRYRLLTLPRRIGAAGPPAFRIIDLQKHATRQGLSTPLLASIDQHLNHGNQVLLFINRRGFAPALFCPQCQTAEECDRCDARMTVHARTGKLLCHHCGRERPLQWACARCGTERIGVGAGTERVTDELRSLYPDRRIERLDRDVTARRGALAAVLEDVTRGDTQILVGTQMLTKGHDFPRVTLVGVLNADQGLFGTDFRSNERLAQTIVQVAGRAGRRDQPGEVVIQTSFPEHPLLRSLLDEDYTAFATLALEERRRAGWPPFSHLAAWRAEATQRPRVFEFLDKLRDHAVKRRDGVEILGPAPAPMERSRGRYRAQLLFQGRERNALHGLVAATLEMVRGWREARRVRWSIDIDPVEI